MERQYFIKKSKCLLAQTWQLLRLCCKHSTWRLILVPKKLRNFGIFYVEALPDITFTFYITLLYLTSLYYILGHHCLIESAMWEAGYQYFGFSIFCTFWWKPLANLAMEEFCLITFLFHLACIYERQLFFGRFLSFQPVQRNLDMFLCSVSMDTPHNCICFIIILNVSEFCFTILKFF